ncbi:MAG: glycosyltransferase [Thermoplasmataceae archaeon]
MTISFESQQTELLRDLIYPYSLSIIIPAYNEEKRIKPLLEELIEFMAKNKVSWEVIISLDGNDGTLQILNSYAQNYSFIRYIKNGQRNGKGNAIKSALSLAEGEYVLFMDSDRSIQFEEIVKHLNSLQNNDCILFERYSNSSNDIPLSRRIVSRGFNFLVRVLLGITVKDTQTGYKLIRTDLAREAFKKITVTNTFFDVTLLYNIKKLEGKIKDVSVSYQHDYESKFNLIPEIIGQGISLLGFKIAHSRLEKYIPKKVRELYYRKFKWV